MFRHLFRKIDKQQKEDTLEGQYLRQYGNEYTIAKMPWEVIEQANTNVKLQTLETLRIGSERTRINTYDEFKSRE